MDYQFIFNLDSIGLGDVLDGGGSEKDREGSVRDGTTLVSDISKEVHTASGGRWGVEGVQMFRFRYTMFEMTMKEPSAAVK